MYSREIRSTTDVFLPLQHIYSTYILKNTSRGVSNKDTGLLAFSQQPVVTSRSIYYSYYTLANKQTTNLCSFPISIWVYRKQKTHEAKHGVLFRLSGFRELSKVVQKAFGNELLCGILSLKDYSFFVEEFPCILHLQATIGHHYSRTKVD